MNINLSPATSTRPPVIKDSHMPSDHLYQQAFDNSLQANIILLVADGSIIRANKAACKLLHYSKKELTSLKRGDLFALSEDYKIMTEHRDASGSVKADISLITKAGKGVPCQITSVIFKGENGVDISILSIVDMTEKIQRQKHIDREKKSTVDENIHIAQSKAAIREEEKNDWITSIEKTSYDVIWDCDVASQMISFKGSYEKVFGYSLPNNKLPLNEWISYFQPAERALVSSKINRILRSRKTGLKDTLYFCCPDGTEAIVIIRGNTLRDQKGKAVRVIGVLHDVSKLHQLEEEKLVREIKISGAIEEAKESERSDIGKELHDNINQLLGASVLYLNMARDDIKNSAIYLIHSSEYIQSAIEEIRKLTRGLTTDCLHNLGLCGTIEDICHDTMQMYPVVIICTLDDTLEHNMSPELRLNVFRIFQEQLNNVLKHAKASNIRVSLSPFNDGFILSVEDDGVGFDTTKRSKGIGMRNMISRAGLYNGTVRFVTESGKGCRMIATFRLETGRAE